MTISPQSSSPSTRTFSLASDLAAVAGTVTQVINALTEQAIAQPPGLDLCLAEALNNAVDHGNGNDPSQRVTVTLQTRAGRMEIIIKDAAGQLEPAMLDAAEMPPPGAESGRGLALVRSLLPDSCVRDGQLVLVLPG